MSAQIIRRTTEYNKRIPQSVVLTEAPHLSKPHSRGPLPEESLGCSQFGEVHTPKFLLRNHSPDNFIGSRGSIYKVINILSCNGMVYVVALKLERERAFFSYPICSNDVGITVVNIDHDGQQSVMQLEEISEKYTVLPLGNKWIALSLIHHG